MSIEEIRINEMLTFPKISTVQPTMPNPVKWVRFLDRMIIKIALFQSTDGKLIQLEL